MTMTACVHIDCRGEQKIVDFDSGVNVDDAIITMRSVFKVIGGIISSTNDINNTLIVRSPLVENEEYYFIMFEELSIAQPGITENIFCISTC